MCRAGARKKWHVGQRVADGDRLDVSVDVVLNLVSDQREWLAVRYGERFGGDVVPVGGVDAVRVARAD
jgi:hypothetical protein